MIRLFTALCKTFLKSLSDAESFQEATDGFKLHDERCPRCGATGKLSPYGDYSRGLISLSGGMVDDQRVKPLRFACGSCGSTHALLPDVVNPYSPYSLRFKLTVLIAYFERDTTVVAICGQFGIAVSTLYEWKKRLLEHKDLLLGVLISQKISALAFLRGLFDTGSISDTLRGFFRKFGLSFMQNPSTSATRSPPP